MQVQLEISDATKREFEEEAFDVIYSRDTILHIKDKKALFSSFFVSLDLTVYLLFCRKQNCFISRLIVGKLIKMIQILNYVTM